MCRRDCARWYCKAEQRPAASCRWRFVKFTPRTIMTSMSTPAVDTALVQLIDTYCGTWNEVDPLRRQSMLSSVWAPGATYTDPTVHVVGAEELLAHIASVIARRPGANVVRTS